MKVSNLWRLAALVAVVACAAPPPGPVPAAVPAVEVPRIDERSLLLLLADRRMYEPFTVNQVFQGDADLRRELAITLGRIGDSRAVPSLRGLALDSDPRVRRAAVFALGELGDPAAVASLLVLARDRDRETGVLAVEALGKLGAVLPELLRELAALAPEERRARLLPQLYRFEGADRHELARQGLTLEDPRLRGLAVYALAREARPAAAPLLRQLLSDPDPRVQAWAAWGLGRVGGPGDLELLEPLLDRGSPAPVIRALQAGERLVREGGAAPAAGWRPRLRALLEEQHPGIRAAAIAAAGAWLLDEELSGALIERIERRDSHDSGIALLALARGADPRAAEAAAAMAANPDPRLREAAAKAAAELGSRELLAALVGDPAAAVRMTALEGLLGLGGDGPAEAARRALEDADPGVRGTALRWLTEHPVLPEEVLRGAVVRPLRQRLVAERQALVRALAARARAEPRERGALVIVLENLANDTDFLVRRYAVEELVELGRPELPLGAVDTRKGLVDYRSLVQRSRRPRSAEIHTRHGIVRLQLACPEAPLTCLNFLQLAAQGFYDGLTFHRLSPDELVEGGDPRADGWGGPGYTLRDEINRLRFERGVVGMALAGPDTAGSRFFITLSAQPQLDGVCTAFGRVVAGDEILDRVVPGDRIERVVEVP